MKRFSLWILALIAGLPAASHAATLTVTTLQDGGEGSLRRAIFQAARGDEIGFQSGLDGTLRLDSTRGALVIDKRLTIHGKVDLTLSGDSKTRIFDILPGVGDVFLENLVLADGNPDRGRGGAIRHQGSGILTLQNCQFSQNQAPGAGGAVAAMGPIVVQNCRFEANNCPSTSYGGGALYNSARAEVRSSFFQNNSTAGYGGAIDSDGPLLVTGCTLAGNFANLGGGGLLAYQNESVVVRNSTFSGNNSPAQGGGADIEETEAQLFNCTFYQNTSDGPGEGLIHISYSDTNSRLTLVNCTLSGNGIVSDRMGSGSVKTRFLNTAVADSSSQNVVTSNGAQTISLGNNLSSDNTAEFNANGDLVSISPNLEALADNGGLVQTCRPRDGSFLINRGQNSVVDGPYSLENDARGPGFARRKGFNVDIGAYERSFNSGKSGEIF